MSNPPKISRRTVLCGLGTAMALPLLEAMLPLSALAQSAKKSRPNRMAYIFVPNGIHMQTWTPATEGAGWVLQASREVVNRRSFVSGMRSNLVISELSN